jgi:hypothetical protein
MIKHAKYHLLTIIRFITNVFSHKNLRKVGVSLNLIKANGTFVNKKKNNKRSNY